MHRRRCRAAQTLAAMQVNTPCRIIFFMKLSEQNVKMGSHVGINTHKHGRCPIHLVSVVIARNRTSQIIETNRLMVSL